MIKIIDSFIYEDKRAIICSLKNSNLSVTNKVLINGKMYNVLKHDILTSIVNQKMLCLLLDTKLEFESNIEIKFIKGEDGS